MKNSFVHIFSRNLIFFHFVFVNREMNASRKIDLPKSRSLSTNKVIKWNAMKFAPGIKNNSIKIKLRLSTRVKFMKGGYEHIS